jgi:hypothetical protein
LPVALFDHVDLVVSSIERSLPFYRELLEPLGVTLYDPDGLKLELVHVPGGPP